jgi:CRISPR-associated protein Cas5 subtype I-B
MKGAVFNIEGRWAHFRKAESNNNPLTHDFITKTALIGLIGAVLGKRRDEMKGLFPKLSKDLLYGVEVCDDVQKISWGFTVRKAVNPAEQGRKRFEFIKEPRYRIAIGLLDHLSEEFYENFANAIEQSEARFTPVLGLHNCPANIEAETVTRGEFENESGSFETRAFVALKEGVKIKSRVDSFRVGLERIPTYQRDFYNPPDGYQRVVYPSNGNFISVEGEHHRFTKDGSKWMLI